MVTQGAHKVQVSAVPSSAAAAAGSLFLKSFFFEDFYTTSWLETESEIHLNYIRESQAVQVALVPVTKSYVFLLMALNIKA